MYAGDEHYSDDITSGIGDRLDQGPNEEDREECDEDCALAPDHDGDCYTLDDHRADEGERRMEQERDDGQELYG
jgi:hypothetical protein